MAVHLTKEQREIAFRWWAKGLSLKAIAKAVGCTHPTVVRVLRGSKYEAHPLDWTPARGRLSVDEREEILLGLSRGGASRRRARLIPCQGRRARDDSEPSSSTRRKPLQVDHSTPETNHCMAQSLEGSGESNLWWTLRYGFQTLTNASKPSFHSGRPRINRLGVHTGTS